MSNRLLFGEPLRLHAPRVGSRHHLLSWAALRSAWRRHHSRRRIPHLDSHLLKDIGVSFAEAEMEANKPFWRD